MGKIVGGDHLDNEERVCDCMAGGDELYLLPESMRGQKQDPPRSSPAAMPAAAAGPSAPSAPPKSEVAKKKDDDGRLRCKNFGCQKMYDPNAQPQPCTHHKSAPIFHETAKWWSCCPDKKAYDWEEFMRIPGCTTSVCTNAPEGQGTKRF